MRLIEEAERQGGAHSNERCTPTKFIIDLPKAGSDKFVKTDVYTAGCNAEAKFLIPYDPAAHVTIPGYNGPDDPNADENTVAPTVGEADALRQRKAGLAVICAVDDRMDLWPRFAHVAEED